MAAFKLVWSAVWRMQASHLVVFVALPLFAALAHALIGVVLLPVLLASPSSRSHEFGAQAAHLAQPGCWLALAPCALADRSLAPWPFGEPEANTADTGAAIEPLFPLPTALTVRHAWLTAWFAWFMLHLVRRERRPRDT